jgi:hypothetical protein
MWTSAWLEGPRAVSRNRLERTGFILLVMRISALVKVYQEQKK